MSTDLPPWFTVGPVACMRGRAATGRRSKFLPITRAPRETRWHRDPGNCGAGDNAVMVAIALLRSWRLERELRGDQ